MYNSIGKKSKSTGRLKGVFLRFLGKSRSRKLLSLAIRNQHRKDIVSFPINVSHVNQIVIILPEEPLQTLYQLKNVISLVSIFKHAAVTLLCAHSIAPILNMIPGLNIIEYDIKERAGFKASFINISDQFKGNVDICFLLDHQPALALQYFACATGASVRIGYDDSGIYPYLNLRVRPSSNKRYLQDWNCSISQMFGGNYENLRWSVAKKTVEEVEHLLKEAGITKNCKLGGIDGPFLMKLFGKETSQRMIESISSIKDIKWYIYDREEQNLAWIQKFNLPVLTGLSVSRTAALVTLSEIIISGNTFLYGLATLLEKSAFGFFSEEDFHVYCPQSPMLKGIIVQSGADQKDNEYLELIRKQILLIN